MKWISARRPSPAMVVALIALFVSLSGVSYGVATGFIDSREIKNNEVRSRDLRNNEIRTRDLRNNEVRGIDIRNSTVQGRDVGLNTLTGDDVREETLGKVPLAAAADTAGKAASADSAGSADSVGGVTLRKIAYAGEISPDFVEILDVGGLSLEARCLSAGTPAMELRAKTAVDNSELVANVAGFPPPDDSDFDRGEDVYVFDGTADGLGRIEYAGSNGSVVSVQGFVRTQADDVRGSTADCGFFGIAEAG